jgi:hypothetical protein
MRAYVVTFVYSGAEKWLDSYLKSLDGQTDLLFELIVFQDQVDFSKEINTKKFPVHFFSVDSHLDIYAIRLAGLKKLKEIFGDALFIFSDIDDNLNFKRVEITKSCFQTSETLLAFSDITLMDGLGNPSISNLWKDRLDSSVSSSDLQDFNMIGFGSCAMRGSFIPEEIMNYYASVGASDWYLFSCLLRDSKTKAQFIPHDLVLYRQHDENCAGLKQIDEARLLRDVSVKVRHFDALSSRYGEKADIERLDSFRKLEKFIQNIDNRLIYINKLNSAYFSHLFWWEHIKTLNEVGIL